MFLIKTMTCNWDAEILKASQRIWHSLYFILFSRGFCSLSRIENVFWQRDNWIDHLHRPLLSAFASHLLCASAEDSDFFELGRENSKMGGYWSFPSRVELRRSLSFPGSHCFLRARRDALLVIFHWKSRAAAKRLYLIIVRNINHLLCTHPLVNKQSWVISAIRVCFSFTCCLITLRHNEILW